MGEGERMDKDETEKEREREKNVTIRRVYRIPKDGDSQGFVYEYFFPSSFIRTFNTHIFTQFSFGGSFKKRIAFLHSFLTFTYIKNIKNGIKKLRKRKTSKKRDFCVLKKRSKK